MSKLSQILKAARPGKASNLRVMLLCFFAATTFWFFNSLNENYSTTIKYPLEFVYDKEQYMAVEPLPDNVQINVSGLGWNLLRNSMGIKVSPLEIPLESPSEVKKIVGSTMPGLITDQLDEFQLNYVLTDTLFVNIDFKVSKRFPLAVDSAAIDTEENYRIVSQIKHMPDSVELTGPSKMIEALPDTIWVRPPQQEIDDNYMEDIAINIPNGNLIKRNPPTVNVAFEVEEFIVKETVQPLRIKNISDKAYIEKEEITLTYKVRASLAEEVNESAIKVVADFKQMNRNDSTIVPRLDSIPAQIIDVEIDTTRIKVKFNE